MKVSLTEEQLLRIQSKLIYEQIIDDMVFKLSLITEDGKTEPDMEWDFTEVKKDIDRSSKWVKTKKDALEYVDTLKNKIKSLPKDTVKKILNYVLISLLGLISVSEIQRHVEPKLKSLERKEKKIIRDLRVRKSSQNLFKHLKDEEKLSLTAYDIGDGAKTIGYGHAVFRGENEGYDFLPDYKNIIPNKTSITKNEAEELLKDDIIDSENVVNKILNDWEEEGIKPKITQGMYDAMVSMAFNMGTGNFRKSEFIKLLKKGDISGAKKQILQTSSNLFDKFPGLKIRRQKEHDMFV